MTIKRYLDLLRDQYSANILLTKDRKRLRGYSRLPATALAMLTGYRPQVIAFLRSRRTNHELDLDTAHLHVAALGFVRLDHGPWSHPDGDAIGEQILAGVLAPPRATTKTEQVIEDIHSGRRKALPAIDNPQLVPVPGRPGTFTYHIRRGQRISRLPGERK